MLRWVAAGLWAITGALFAVLLLLPQLQSGYGAWWLPPVIACLVLAALIGRGGQLGFVAAIVGTALAAVVTLFTVAFSGYGQNVTPETTDSNTLYAAITATLAIVSGLAAWQTKQITAREILRSAPALEAARASGTVSDQTYAFELARLELARTGKRRLFVCGRCGKGLSLGWTRCGHCNATFDEFPPIDTGQTV